MKQLEPESLDKWRSQLQRARPSAVLREIAGEHGWKRRELGPALMQLYSDVSALDVKTIWVWSHMEDECGGIGDTWLDEELAPLVERNRPATPCAT